MRKAITLSLLLLAAIIAGDLVARDKSVNGVYRPTLSTNPKKYLRDFPLGKIATEEIIQYVGSPDKNFSLNGSDFVTYNISPKQTSGVIEYTFEIRGGIVINVTYLNSGNFFGATQRESAKELQPR
ncbi:hypothetical protein [Lysobacter sp. CA196]|uniref:hypothetical protein n=1 Tax=Lysobacter sp. CA196 TaxID=3455606 RepID=UPI003F8D4A72